MREDFLPFARPTIEDDEIAEVVDTLKSGWLTTGPKTLRFEKEFKEYVGAPHALAVSSCTAGMHLALAAAGIGPGDEVITTTFTFCATANVIIHTGATPVLVDIREDFNIDPGEIKKRITPRTRAIMPVHFAGQPCAMDEILDIARRHKLLVIEDAAHALGAKHHDKMIGTLGEATVFSFYPTKIITTGEGGMVTCHSDELRQKMDVLRLHGMSRDAWKRYTSAGSWYYEITAAGFKYNMTDIQAALGLRQLAKVERFIRERQEQARFYDEALAEVPGIKRPLENPGGRHVWHIYVIQVDAQVLDKDRTAFIEALKAENIGTSVHFIPLHLHPYYQEQYGYRRGDFPVAERIYEGIISLPLFPGVTRRDQEYVVEAVTRLARPRHR